MKNILNILSSQSNIIEAKGNEPLLLDNVEKVWIIKSGQMDIFSIQVRDKETIGPRNHIFRASEGEALFGMDIKNYDQDLALLASGTPGTLLVECEKSRLFDLLQYPDHTETIEALIMNWVDRLSTGISQNAIFPNKYQEMIKGAKITTEEDTFLRTQDLPVWIFNTEGHTWFMGRNDWPEIPPKRYFPVSKNAWVLSSGKTHLYTTGIKEVISEDKNLESLNSFHRFILDCIFVNIRQSLILEENRLKRKKEADQSNLNHAILQLGKILDTKKAGISPKAGEKNALISACHMIGNAMGIKIRDPERSEEEDSSEITLEDIARNSGFRTRKVILKDNWWSLDQGPLLAFLAEKKQPVALIPKSPGRYNLHDPMKGTIEKVTPATAEIIAPEAFVFYRPFPERPLNGFDLFRFGFHGCGMDLTTIIFMGVLGALLGLLTPVMTGIIFDTIIPEAASSQLVQISVILITCAVATALFDITKGVALLRLEGKMDFSILAALWDRLLSLPVPFFRDYSAGDLANRAMGINQIRQILSGVAINSILSALFSSFSLALLFYYDWQLALVGIGLSLISIFATCLTGFLMVRHQRKINEIEGRTSGIVLQFITGIAKLRVSGTEDRAFAEWTKSFTEKKRLAYKAGTIQNILTSFNSMFPVIASMAIFTWVIWKSIDSGLSTGSFLAFSSAYGTFQAAMLQMAMVLTASLNIIPLYERARPIIAACPESDETKANPGELSGDINIHNIRFRYNPDGPLILKDVSLHVSPGEFVAIVGGSGSGKSTLLRCLLGFETPGSGSIYYDNQDLTTLDLREVRRQTGVVLQNARLMSGDIFKNIVGTSGLTVEDAWEAARMVGVEEDIRAMPMGMHTMISAGGSTLSGGQRQRLIIARAVAKRPRILFFDEATSALDNRTQAIVSRSLERLKVTRLVIAHRLSTIINADRIYVLQNGEVIESGAYEELMDLKGFFSELAKRQIA